MKPLHCSTVTTTNSNPETPCLRCGTLAPHRVEEGQWGPHLRRLLCEACGAFVQWLPATTPEDRRQQRELARAQWMQSQPPTVKQLTFLQHLGHKVSVAHRLEASRVIDRLLQQRGAL